MNIEIIAVGRLKEKYFKDASNEYLKRLARFAKVKITEVSDEKNPINPSDKEIKQLLDKEGALILEKIKPNQYVIALCIEGDKLSSKEFSLKIKSLAIEGKSDICFIIGGSMGLCDSVKKRADLCLSFSDMTFPHQLMRIILLEQIYRCFMIIEGSRYHK